VIAEGQGCSSQDPF